MIRKEHQCPHCDFNTDDFWEYVEHMKRKHAILAGEKRKVPFYRGKI